MDAEKWQHARALFESLAEIAPGDWRGALDTLGIVDPELREEVLALLAADRADLLRTAVDGHAPEMLSELAEANAVDSQRSLRGQVVGAFRLIEEIGRGGMGTVWSAERIDGGFAQKVAIKLIRPEWDAAEMLARFRAERQILAHLGHPNIARLIDGGMTGDGRPWLALEHVDGVDLRTYCDERQLDLESRLRLFLTVCAAVSHAHAHLVVHRDLKPSNLLVTADGEVKLLDFGIAKLISVDGVQASRQRLFTPEYAAPEQVRGDPVTTAVDVHALGLLLYELLTGCRPYKVANSTPAAYERAILDQEPTRPSLAFTGDGAGDDLAERAAQREMSPQRLRRELRGDLDAIVLKALRKQAEQRYASVAELAADIDNHLQRRPVAARRGNWRYRSARFLRRHALAALFAGIAIAALVAGLAAALWQAGEARVQRDLARAEGDKSTQTLEFLLDIFRSADPAATSGARITAEDLLARGVERAEHHRFDDPGVHFDLLMVMGEAYLGIGAAKDASVQFKRALEVQQARLPAATLKRVRALTLLARSQGGIDDPSGAAANLAEAARLLPAEAADSELAADLAATRGIHRMTRGDITGAIEDLSKATALFVARRGAGDDTTASAAITLSWAYDDQDRHDEARALLEPIVAAMRASAARNPVRFADALDALANTYGSSAEADAASQMRKESLEITRRVYGETHRYVGIRLNNLASSLLRSHDYAGANAAMKEALELARAQLAPGSSRLGSTYNNLATTEYALGHWADAERSWNEALAIRRAGNDPTDTAYTLTGIAGARREQGDLAAARLAIDEAIVLLRAQASPRPSHLARTLIERTEVGLAEGRVDCAAAEEAAGLMQANTSSDDPHRLHVEVVAAVCAQRATDTAATRERARDALAAMRAGFPPDAVRLAQVQRYFNG